VNGDPNKLYLDITDANVVTVMTARLDKAVTLGCDGVEIRDAQNYMFDTGFTLAAGAQ
jgi:hypothetical protein